MSTNQDKCHDGIESNGNLNKEETRKTWVKFDDESPQTNGHQSDGKISSTPSTSLPAQQEVPAVLNTETVHVNLERGDRNLENTSHGNLSKDVEFVNIRTGFSNGDLLVTVLPVNVSWPWITLARFRPELVPEELMAQGLTLTVEEYVHAMELLVNDARFTIYNMCYKRVIFCWITVAFVVLLCLLFSGITGKVLFSLGVSWLVLNIAGIILCMEIKRKLTKGVELCLGKINKSLTKHNLLLALDDRGKISCHKLNLCFIYFDSGPCIAHIQQFIESEEGKAVAEGWEKRLGITVTDIVIQGSQTTRLSRKEDMAELVYYRYLQRWGKDYLRRNLYWTLDEEGGIPAAPRHLPQALCPCQYVEEIMRYKEPQEKTVCCAPLIN